MRWTERQRALLQGMGLRVWGPTAPAGAVEAADAVVASAREASRARTRPDAAALDADGDVAVAEHEKATRDTAAPPAPAARQPAAPGALGVPGSPSVAVSMLDGPALRDRVAACTACRLCDSRRQTVVSAVDRRADWMVVGEAPGEPDDAQGEPFVGRSGPLLDNMLRAIGVARAAPAHPDDAEADPAHRAYLTHTVKCRPPGDRNPAADEIACCEPYLLRQIDLLRPKIILAMGRFAAQGLLRSDAPFGQLRGRVHRYHDVPLVVTYDPDYLLRRPEEKARAWDDLCLALETLRAIAPPP